MGAWGPGLYQDDVAVEVRDYYKDQLRRGKTGAEITQVLISENKYLLSDSDDSPIFWFALADTQWSLGRLEDFVREQALYYIRIGTDIKRWEMNSAKEAKIRAKVLSDLERKLLLPQPVEKKIPQYKLYHCKWKIGDVYAYPFESEYANKKGFSGKYLLLNKVDEAIWHPGHIIPIVRVKITADGSLPVSKDEFNKVEYVQTSFSRFDPLVEEFRVDPENLTEKEFWTKVEEKKASYIYDDFGLLPVYRVKLISTSSRIIPKKLVWVGNFSDVSFPENEFVPGNKIEIPSVHWKDLEKTMIDSYCGHNLRQFEIYSKSKQRSHL